MKMKMKKTQNAVAVCLMLLFSTAAVSMDIEQGATLYDLELAQEKYITDLFANYPGTPPTPQAYQAALGAIRASLSTITAEAYAALAANGGVTQTYTAYLFASISNQPVWRDIIAAGLPIGNTIIANYYPEYTMNPSVWNGKGAAAAHMFSYMGFMIARFYAQEVGQLSIRRRYPGFGEQPAKWAAFGVSYAMAQVFTSFLMPQMMNTFFILKKDKEQDLRRKLLNINVCDPDILLATRNKYNAGNTTCGVATDPNWTYWNNKYLSCVNTYNSRGTNYTQVRQLFVQPVDTLTFDPDPAEIVPTVGTHPDPGMENLITHIATTVTVTPLTVGTRIQIPSYTVNGVTIPSFSGVMEQVYTGSTTGYNTIKMTFSVGGKPNVTITYLKSLTVASFPPAPTVWPPYQQP